MNEEDDDTVMYSINIGEDNLFVSPDVTLLSYMRADGMTGIGFHFQVYDLDQRDEEGNYLTSELRVVTDGDQWLPDLLTDLMDYYTRHSNDARLIQDINEAVVRHQERIKDEPE